MRVLILWWSDVMRKQGQLGFHQLPFIQILIPYDDCTHAFDHFGQIGNGEEIKKEFVILFLFWKELKHPHLFAILLKVFDKLFDVIVFLTVIDTENDAD